MRDIFLSTCEKSFLSKVVSEGYRLDGRNYNETRNLNIAFGTDYGSCIVSLGETKVLAQVSCEVVQPKQIRPHEGILYVNAEISSMAGPQFEANRQADLAVYLNRLLEKCYKDSKCIDLESLCITVEEKVWSLRVDIKVLNHEGNIIECASIATLSALAHFKRPDVTRSGDSVTIHTLAEKDPIPTVLFHYPVCVTFAILEGHILLSDPSFVEESICTRNTEEGTNTGGGLLVIGMNQYKEICLLDHSGATIEENNLVHKAITSAAEKCKEIVDLVKKSIASDDTLRQKRVKTNFSDIISEDNLLTLSKKDLTIKLKNYNMDDNIVKMELESDMSDTEPSKYDVVASAPQTVETQTKKDTSKWIEISSDSEEDVK
ncbi:exosome complex component Rrp45 [Anticarsia gemmatalis]|uniref:exosome complex component Rrp45 n=1 Tax=Anticarsia gemmatalis TaxID=129554 RepID=UPI003F763F21